jgi:hypothetical protein
MNVGRPMRSQQFNRTQALHGASKGRLRPRTRVLGQPIFVVDNPDLVWRHFGPIPEDDVDVGCGRPARITRHHDPRDAAFDEPVSHEPTWRTDAQGRHVLPGAGQIRGRDGECGHRRRIGQIQDILAIDIVSTQRQRLSFESECLLCLQPGRLEPKRRVQARRSGRIETAAVKSCAFPGIRGPRPFWIVSAVDRPCQLQA